MTENLNPDVPIPERGDSSTGDMAEGQVGTPKVGGVSPTEVPVPKKFPLLTTILLILLSLLAAFSIYLFLQVRTLTLEKTISPSPTPSPISSAEPTPNDTSKPPSVCIPTYQVETNTPELTAKQNYAMQCSLQHSKEECLAIDIYNQKADDFSAPDRVSDCEWKEPFFNNPPPNESIYTCPKNGWQNCMPILSEEGQKACSTEAVTWYKRNCPNFEGVAQ